MISDSSYQLCKHFNESIGCLNITQTGCQECKEGMYLSKYECYDCPNECQTCRNKEECLLLT